MEILINSTQTNKIIVESTFKDIGNSIKTSYEFVKDVLSKGGNQIGENLTFLVTWGASIGGLIRPLNSFIQNKNPEFSDIEISLLLTGIICSYFVDNKTLVTKIVKKINESGLSRAFTDVFTKSEELKRSFFDFIESLNITFHKMTNILSYAFIIPLIPMIYNGVSEGVFSENDIVEFSKRISGFGLVTLSGVAIKNFIQKIIKRFKSN